MSFSSDLGVFADIVESGLGKHLPVPEKKGL
jgi:hypothetical protein